MPGRLEKEELPRRDFLGLAGMWASGIAIFGSLAGMARLAKPRVSPDASSIFRLGQAEDFPPGSIIDLPAQGVRVMSTEAGIAVLSLVCTHLGCVVKPSEEGFGCPCHGSRFDIHGKVMGGPAPRPLRWLALSQTPDGTLLADKAQEVPPGQYLKA